MPSYQAALNPCDQIFDWEELEYYYQVANLKPTAKDMEPNEDESGSENDEDGDESHSKVEDTPVKESPVKEEPASVIDNPFLKSLKKVSC